MFPDFLNVKDLTIAIFVLNFTERNRGFVRAECEDHREADGEEGHEQEKDR